MGLGSKTEIFAYKGTIVILVFTDILNTFSKISLKNIGPIRDPSINFHLIMLGYSQTVAPYICRIACSKKACQNFAVIIDNLCYCRVCILQKTFLVTVLYPFIKVWNSFRCKKSQEKVMIRSGKVRNLAFENRAGTLYNYAHERKE